MTTTATSLWSVPPSDASPGVGPPDDDPPPQQPAPRQTTRSRFANNNPSPTLSEIATIDGVIEEFLGLVSGAGGVNEGEVTELIGRNVKVVSNPRFFVRIAERCDRVGGGGAEGDEDEDEDSEGARLRAVAEMVERGLGGLVKGAEGEFERSGNTLLGVLRPLADEGTGEFAFPLPGAKLEVLRGSIRRLHTRGKLDETLMQTIDNWGKKASDDGLDGMVGLLGSVARTVAGVSVYGFLTGRGGVGDGRGREVLKEIVRVEPEEWDGILSEHEDGKVMEEILGEIQVIIERQVLGGMDTGSVKQRVIAEFLGGVVERVNDVKGRREEE